MTIQTASKILDSKDKSLTGLPFVGPLSSIFILLLFPFFFIYHYGLGNEWWPALFGGLFGYVAFLSAISGTILFFRKCTVSQIFSDLPLMIFCLIAYMFGWFLINSINYNSYFFTLAIQDTVFTGIIWIGILYVSIDLTTNPKELKILIKIALALIVLGFGHAYYIGGFPLGPFLVFHQNLSQDQSTYQGIGRSILIISLLTAYAIRPHSFRSYLVLFTSAILLMTLGSRAHFFALIISFCIHLTATTFSSSSPIKTLAGISIALAFVFTGYDLFSESRNAEILNLSVSNSWILRNAATYRALEIISEYPLMGLYGYHLWDEAGYAHNLLSTWTQYGLCGFVAYILTTFYSFITALTGFLHNRWVKPNWYLALQFNCISIILSIASEPIMYSVLPPFAWGLTIRAQLASSRPKIIK